MQAASSLLRSRRCGWQVRWHHPSMTYRLWTASATQDHNFLNMSHPSLFHGLALKIYASVTGYFQSAHIFNSLFGISVLQDRARQRLTSRHLVPYWPCPLPSFLFLSLATTPSLTQALMRMNLEVITFCLLEKLHCNNCTANK